MFKEYNIITEVMTNTSNFKSQCSDFWIMTPYCSTVDEYQWF
jgi:hypothetical protein